MKAIVRRFGGPVLLLLVAIACGHVPGEADGATLAGVPNIVFILLNVCLTCYALGMIHGRLTANSAICLTGGGKDGEGRVTSA